jgi:hypothetical protein
MLAVQVRVTTALPGVAVRLAGAAGGTLGAIGVAEACAEFALSPAALSDETT